MMKMLYSFRPSCYWWSGVETTPFGIYNEELRFRTITNNLQQYQILLQVLMEEKDMQQWQDLSRFDINKRLYLSTNSNRYIDSILPSLPIYNINYIFFLAPQKDWCFANLLGLNKQKRNKNTKSYLTTTSSYVNKFFLMELECTKMKCFDFFFLCGNVREKSHKYSITVFPVSNVPSNSNSKCQMPQATAVSDDICKWHQIQCIFRHIFLPQYA